MVRRTGRSPNFGSSTWAAFEGLFVQVVQIAREAGVVHLGTLAIDGTKVQANASKHKAMSYGRMRDEETRIRAQIAALTAQAATSDATEDVRPAEWSPPHRRSSS